MDGFIVKAGRKTCGTLHGDYKVYNVHCPVRSYTSKITIESNNTGINLSEIEVYAPLGFGNISLLELFSEQSWNPDPPSPIPNLRSPGYSERLSVSVIDRPHQSLIIDPQSLILNHLPQTSIPIDPKSSIPKSQTPKSISNNRYTFRFSIPNFQSPMITKIQSTPNHPSVIFDI